jgi:hypothetical protein
MIHILGSFGELPVWHQQASDLDSSSDVEILLFQTVDRVIFLFERCSFSART